VTEGFRVQAWGYTFLLVFLYLVNWADKALLGLVAQPLAHELHLSASQIGLAGSAFFLAFTLSGLLAGVISKRSSLQWSLGLTALAWAICLVPMTLLPSFTMLLVTRSALGLAEGPNSALLHTALYSWHPPARRGVPSAWVTACSSLTKILSAPVVDDDDCLVPLARSFLDVGRNQRGLVLRLACRLGRRTVWTACWQHGCRGIDRSAGKSQLDSCFLLSYFHWLCRSCHKHVHVDHGRDHLVAGLISRSGLASLGCKPAQCSAFPASRRSSQCSAPGISETSCKAEGEPPECSAAACWQWGLLLCGLSMVVLPYIHSQLTAVFLISFGYGAGSIALPLSNACVSQICPPRQLPGALGLFFSVMSVGGIVAPYVTGLLVELGRIASRWLCSRVSGIRHRCNHRECRRRLTINPERDCLNIDALTKG